MSIRERKWLKSHDVNAMLHRQGRYKGNQPMRSQTSNPMGVRTKSRTIPTAKWPATLICRGDRNEVAHLLVANVGRSASAAKTVTADKAASRTSQCNGSNALSPQAAHYAGPLKCLGPTTQPPARTGSQSARRQNAADLCQRDTWLGPTCPKLA